MNNDKYEFYSMLSKENQRPSDLKYFQEISNYWDNSIGTNLDKLRAFTKYVPFTEFPKFLAKYEIFKKIINIHGGIIECGVHQGAGLMTWALLSSIFEPVNHKRKIIGFDTFEGFAEIASQDYAPNNEDAKVGGLSVDSFADIQNAIKIYDMFRPLGHINKVELVKGDANTTIENYIQKNPHLVVSLLYLDFDVYVPTKRAIELLRSRMPIGSIIAFDELYHKDWPGETQALVDTLGIFSLKIERFPFHPQISYAILT
jgi:hypothetical protein